MKQFSTCLIFFVATLMSFSQDDSILIHIRLVNGVTGLPIKNLMVGLEEQRAGIPHEYAEVSTRADDSGVANLRIHRNSIILTHNTHEYVDCGDENGGLIHNDYKVSDIVSTGIVEPIKRSKICTKTSGSAKPGELTLYVRPWLPGEDM